MQMDDYRSFTENRTRGRLSKSLIFLKGTDPPLYKLREISPGFTTLLAQEQ